MPAYFSMTIQIRAERLTDSYVEQMYSSIMELGYSFKSGFWFHENATYNEIVDWNQKKLEQGFRLGYTEHGSHDYMQILFDAKEYEVMRCFWRHMGDAVEFEVIVPEYEILNFEDDCTIRQDMIEPLQEIGIHIWEKGLADAIQTSFEGDGGCYNLAHALNREKLMIHPFAIISADTATDFNNQCFNGKVLSEIGNYGILIK